MVIRLTRMLLLFLSFGLVSAQLAYACSCIYAGHFTEYSEGASVIRGTVESYGSRLEVDNTSYPTMKISVDGVIKGTYAHEIVDFVGDSGGDCFGSINPDLYPIGGEYLFVVVPEAEQQSLGGCGEASISIVDGKVIGQKWRRKWLRRAELVEYSVDYQEFIRRLK